ncbi:MAG: hypothetical protein ACYTEV_12140, partial [Planctomycetota bacterium]
MRPFRPAVLACLLLMSGASLATASGPFSRLLERRGEPEATPAAERLTLEELTLERLFPEDPVFGPSASDMAFSRDGRYAAWLHRPALERRHGRDLWLLDTATGAVERITSVSVMREFQASTRKVSEDRIAKARARARAAAGDAVATDPPVATDDGLSGTWTGTMLGDPELVGEGMEIIFTLRLGADGRVEGTAQTALGTATLTEGRFADGTLD